MNRCLGPMIAEAMALVQTGTDPLALNEAMKAFGFPVGPITLADEVGIDVTTHVVHNLTEDLGPRMAGADLAFLDELVAAKILGKKSRAGFFKYDEAPKGAKPGAAVKGGKELNPKVMELLAKCGRRTLPPFPALQPHARGRLSRAACARRFQRAPSLLSASTPHAILARPPSRP